MSVRIDNQARYDQILKPRNQFSEFCEETTLNGWYYLAKRSVGKVGRSYWLLEVVCSLVLSGWFIYGATNQFMEASVIITVDSVTASLDKVLFPSLVVCNQNQVSSQQEWNYKPCNNVWSSSKGIENNNSFNTTWDSILKSYHWSSMKSQSWKIMSYGTGPIPTWEACMGLVP